jgi:hypothetical protein
MSDYQAEAGRGDNWCCAFARNAGVIGTNKPDEVLHEREGVQIA